MQDTEWEDVVVGNTQSVVDGYTGNIDLASRPVYTNADGSISTEVSMSFNDKGKEVLIPTIRTENGKRIDMSQEEAIAWYDKSGEHLGIFDTVEEAEVMAQKIHSRFDVKPDDTDWEDVKPATQSVMDDRDGKIYNVPLAMDGIDTRFEIDTQHKGADKGSFFGKLDLDVNAFRDLQAKLITEGYNKAKSAVRGAIGTVQQMADTLIAEGTGLRDEQYKAEHGYSRYPSFFFGSDNSQEEVKAEAKETVAKLEDIRKRNKEWWDAGKEFVRKEEEMDDLDKFFEGLGGGATSVATSITSTLALRNPAVAATAMALLYGEMRKNELMDEALEQGIDFDKAEMIGVGGGIIEGGLEFAGDLLLSRFAKLKPIMEAKDRVMSSAVVKAAKDRIGKEALKKIATKHTDSVIGGFAKGFASEMFEEMSQTGAGMAYENVTGLSNHSLDEIYSNVLMSGIIGGLTGGVPGAVGTAFNNKLIRKTNNQIKELIKQDAPSLNDQELQVMADSVQEMLYQESTTYVNELNNVLEKEKQPEVLNEGLTPEQLTAETRKLLQEKYNMKDEDINKTIKSALSIIDARGQFNEAYSQYYDALTTGAGRSSSEADGAARLLAARALAVARAEKVQVKDVMDRWNLQFKKTAWNEGDVDNARYQESMNIAIENAELDKVNPAYEGEVIDIDGVEHTVYNSDGSRIAQSEPALRNFYNWFGDSKVVDEQGRPLVMYHNTTEEFDTFSREKIGSSGSGAYHGYGFNFARFPHSEYGRVEIPVYLKASKPLSSEAKTITKQQLKKLFMTLDEGVKDTLVGDFAYGYYPYGSTDYARNINTAVDNLYDGAESDLDIYAAFSMGSSLSSDKVIDAFSSLGYDSSVEYRDGKQSIVIVFNPNQIKSTSNRGTFNPNDENIYFQGGAKTTHVVKPYTDRKNPSRLLHRQDDNMLPEEKKAWDDFFASRSDADRIKANLEKYKGTPWERLAREQVFVHHAINLILDGKTPDFESALDTVSYGKKVTSDINSIASILREIKVLSGGSGLKTVHSVNSSFLNCNPTPGCAKYCYAASALLGRTRNWLKPVLIDTLAENRPDLLAQMIVDQFKVSPLGVAGNKAIRLFDEGDGAPHWINVIKEINNLGYRVAIFTKRKEFAWEVINNDNKKYGTAYNLVMFSSDASNFKEIEGDDKIPVAFVYSDESEIPMIKKMSDNGQVRVILPIKLKGGKGIANEVLQELFNEVPEVRPHVCPIDAGFKKIDPRVYVEDGDVKLADKESRGWNCAFCDRKGGVGCYFGFSTEKMDKMINKAKELKKTEEADMIDQFRNLFTLIEALKQGDYVNDRRYKEAGIIVRQDKQGDDGVLQDVATSATGRRGDLGWLVGVLNKRLSDVSGAVKRVSEAAMPDSSSRGAGVMHQSSEGNSGYDTGVRDDGRGSSGSSSSQSGINDAFFQSAPTESPRGAYQNNIIYLFENADASTIIHEMGHFFLDDMQKFSDNETTKEQLEAIYKFVGSTDGKLTREQHEYFANAFELYLLEGRAPNNTLQKVFIRFKNWLGRLFAELSRINDVKLTPEIRKVFGQMLGGRGLDFSMQMSGAKMMESLESGVIPGHIVDRAIRLLEEGKMSRADMDDILERLKSGDLKRKEVAQELKKFESGNVKHNEALNPFDRIKYREALSRGNFSKKDVVEKINRLLKWSEPRSQNGKLVGRFSDKRMNQRFAHLRELMAMDKAQAKEKIAENIKLINAIIKGEEVGDTDALAFDNRVLGIVTGKAKAETVIDIYNAISDSYNLGRLTTAVTGEAKKARRARLVQETKDVLTNNGTVNWRQEQSKLKQFVNQLGTSQMSWQGILDILSMNDKSSKTGQSKLSKALDVFEAQQIEAQGVADDGEKASKFMEKRLGGANNAAISVSRYVNSKLQEKFTIEWDGNKKTFTKDQLLDIYMKSKDPETKKMMAEDKILQFNDNFLIEVNQILTAEDRAIANALFEFYDDNYAKINAFYEDKYGISLGKRAFYSPRSMDRGGINVDTGDLSSYAGFSAVKERKAKAGAVKIKGAFQVLQDYIVNSNHWIAWSDKLIDINAVMGDVEVKNMIRNMFGQSMERRIAYEVSRMASNDKFQSKYFNFELLNKIRSNYAISALAAKPSLMIKQLTSFPAYWEHMSKEEFISGLVDFTTHMKEAVETLGNTTLMKTRDVNIIKDFEELSKSELFKSGATKVKLREFLMANIKLGDRGAIYMGGWALYRAELKKNLAKGMKQEDAKAKALEMFERVTDETQQSGRLSQQSYWQSNPFLRMFTMFQSSQNQYLRKEINAIRGLATGRMSKPQVAKTLFIFHVLLPCFFQFASDGFEWDKEAQLRASILGSLNGIFILNSILERGLDIALGTADAWRATKMGISDVLPFWGSGEDLYKFFVDLAEGDVDLEDYIEVIKAFGKPLGELTGVPVKYPLDLIQNFGDYAEEGEVKKEVLLWLGWSPYALRDKDEE